MSNADFIAALIKLLHERQSFLITSHARPDGDAIGSAVGLMHMLESMGKEVTVAFADPIPVIYKYLPGVDHIVHTLPSAPAECAILLECGSVERSGFPAIPARFTINIDHHKSCPPFADFNWIEPRACAVGAMIYDVAIAAGIHLTRAMATCLYTAVLTDTGSFTYTSTEASTFALAEHLVERGADANQVAQAVYFSNPPSKIRLLGLALNRMVLENEVAYSHVTLADMQQASAVAEDCEGVVNYLIGIAGVETAAFFREAESATSATEFRTSLRSKSAVDVAIVAELFGGGGHRNASGCNLPGPLDQAMARVIAELHAACRAALAAKPANAGSDSLTVA
jgi:phosphoesterase RecJ-like protein